MPQPNNEPILGFAPGSQESGPTSRDGSPDGRGN